MVRTRYKVLWGEEIGAHVNSGAFMKQFCQDGNAVSKTVKQFLGHIIEAILEDCQKLGQAKVAMYK